MRGSWSPEAPGSSVRAVAGRLAADGRVPVLLDALLPQAHRDRPPELARQELAGREGVAVANDATVKVLTAEALGGGDLHARVAGVADHLADDAHALRSLHSASPRWAPRAAAVGGAPTEEAAVDPAELHGAVVSLEQLLHRAERATAAPSRTISVPANVVR
jgi:hypothetical protein